MAWKRLRADYAEEAVQRCALWLQQDADERGQHALLRLQELVADGVSLKPVCGALLGLVCDVDDSAYVAGDAARLLWEQEDDYWRCELIKALFAQSDYKQAARYCRVYVNPPRSLLLHLDKLSRIRPDGVYQEIVYAMSMMPSDDPIIIKRLRDGSLSTDADCCRTCITGLSRRQLLADHQTAIWVALSHPHNAVRSYACLEVSRDASAFSRHALLLALLRHDAHPQVREHAHAALKAVEASVNTALNPEKGD